MTLEELARGAIDKVGELQAQLAALKEENERLEARMAELAAPAVQGEPVAHLRRDQLQQIKTRGPVVGEISPSPRGDMVAVYAAMQSTEQQPVCPTCYGRGWDTDCQDESCPTTCPDCAGSGKAEHSITVHESGSTGADVSALVEALEQCITSMLDSGYRANAVVIRAARAALSAHRKGGCK